MRLLIAGGRGYIFKQEDIDLLDMIAEKVEIEIVITGGATGADAYGEQWAKARGIPTVIIPPDWAQYGKSAGPRRNKLMVLLCDTVVLFPGGKGTQSTYDFAVKHDRKIVDVKNLPR